MIKPAIDKLSISLKFLPSTYLKIPKSTNPIDMKLLSWNIQWGRGIDGCVDLVRIVRTINQLGDFDVICLQEVAIGFPGLPGSHGENQVIELTKLLSGYTALYGVAVDVPNSSGGGRSQFGNAIFTRLPVGQAWRHLLPWQMEPVIPSMQRMLLEVVVTANTGPLRIMTTHLEYYSQRQREIQIEAIRNLHREACAMSQRQLLSKEKGGTFEVFPRPAEALLCGDFNFPATAPERAQILAPFNDGTLNFHDAWSVIHTNTLHAPTVGIHSTEFVAGPECFDFVFITDGLVNRLSAYGVDAETKASDHQPIWIEFK